MPSPANLTNPRFFPALASLPSSATDTASGFYTAVGPHFIPSRHWCLFAEITHDHEPLKLQAADKSGREITILYSSAVNDALGKFFAVGHTVVMMYPFRRSLEDGSVGVKVREEGRVMVVPLSGTEFRALNGRVRRQNEVVEGTYACHGCGVRKERRELLVCGKLGWRGIVKCQTHAWKGKGHKADCKVLKDIKGLFTLDWEEYHHDVRFPLA